MCEHLHLFYIYIIVNWTSGAHLKAIKGYLLWLCDVVQFKQLFFFEDTMFDSVLHIKEEKKISRSLLASVCQHV